MSLIWMNDAYRKLHQSMKEVFYGDNRRTNSTDNGSPGGESDTGKSTGGTATGSPTFDYTPTSYIATTAAAGTSLASGLSVGVGDGLVAQLNNLTSAPPGTVWSYDSNSDAYYGSNGAIVPAWNLASMPHPPQGSLSSFASAQQQQQAVLYSTTGIQNYTGWPTIAVTVPPPCEPTKLKTSEVRAGEIIAWRGWHIDGDYISLNKLVSVCVSNVWEKSVPMEGDVAGGYGVFAYKKIGSIFLDNYISKESNLSRWVVGQVALWGDVIEHADGYRAQFARPYSFTEWGSGVSEETKKALTDKYLSWRKKPMKDVA